MLTLKSVLGRVLNLDNSDLIQSVGQGGNDAVVDCRGISNYIKTQKVPHVVTDSDVLQVFIPVAVVFDEPYADANYTIAVAVEVNPIPLNVAAYGVGSILSVSSTGFTIIVHINAAHAGDMLFFHVITIHD